MARVTRGTATKDYKQGNTIKDIYVSRGVGDLMPRGKGVHQPAFHRMVAGILAGWRESGELGKENRRYSNAAAIAMDKLGPGKAVNPSHRR